MPTANLGVFRERNRGCAGATLCGVGLDATIRAMVTFLQSRPPRSLYGARKVGRVLRSEDAHGEAEKFRESGNQGCGRGKLKRIAIAEPPIWRKFVPP